MFFVAHRVGPRSHDYAKLNRRHEVLPDYALIAIVSPYLPGGFSIGSGMTGLRPSPLPHRQTCGFPHPAVDRGALYKALKR
jgi:hypothetical protein